MTTLTLTPEKARNLHIPATEELLRGWVGPVRLNLDSVVDWAALRLSSVHGWPTAHIVGPQGDTLEMSSKDGGFRLYLPLSRPEVIDRLYRVFAAGARCPDSIGQVHAPVLASPDIPPFCPKCRDTLWLRPPTDLSHFRGVKAEGWGAELEAALLWVSWVRMAGGVARTDAEHLAANCAVLDVTPEGPVIRAEVPDALR
jgi:hypothetical protein